MENNWIKFEKCNTSTHPTKIGWYFVTVKFSDKNSFNPSENIKLVGVAHWSGELGRYHGGFDTLKNDLGDLMLSENISNRVVAYQEIVFPEAAKDPEEQIEEAEDEDEYI